MEDIISFFSNFKDIFSNIGSDVFTNFLSSFISLVCKFFLYVFKFFFGWVNLPDFPDVFKQSLLTFEDLIYDNVGLLGFFVRPITLTSFVDIFIAIFTFKNIFMIIKYFVNKMFPILQSFLGFKLK
ncbi:MAG: hypothetical protein J6M60_03555 [Clostridia bacterium]|nr:hypothetical protein [Clostridia bacterium]